MQNEASPISRPAVKEHRVRAGLGTEISRLFAKCGIQCDIPELQGNEIDPVSFEE